MYRLVHWRMDVHHGDAIKLVPEMCAKSIEEHPNCPIMVYFDPPWGGPNYKEEKDGVNLYLSSTTEVLDVSLELLRKNCCSIVSIKVPYNYIGLSKAIDESFVKTCVKIWKSDGQRVDYVLIFLAKR